MAYSELTLLFDIKRLIPNYQRHMQKWIWEAERGQIGHQTVLGSHRPSLADEQSRFIFSLHLYCWYIYRLTNTDKSDQIIGREWDTDPFSLTAANIAGVAFGGYLKGAGGGWTKAENHPPPGLNVTPQARGNVLKMDKWHPTMNDCWVLGGIHRLATFKLVSPRIPENIWNHKGPGGGYFVVTAREVLGLLYFGYESKREKDCVLLIPKDIAKARSANLVDYWKHIEEKSLQKTNIILELLDRSLKSTLNAEILAFDKSTLKPVPPR